MFFLYQSWSNFFTVIFFTIIKYPPGNESISHQTGSSENHRLQNAIFWGICDRSLEGLPYDFVGLFQQSSPTYETTTNDPSVSDWHGQLEVVDLLKKQPQTAAGLSRGRWQGFKKWARFQTINFRSNSSMNKSATAIKTSLRCGW